MKVPKQYQWLYSIKELPLMIVESLKLYGIYEVKGAGDNPIILGWAKEIGIGQYYKHDETAWCGLAHAIVAKRANKVIPTPPVKVLWALNWANWGVGVHTAMLGDTIVKKRFNKEGELIGGHVTTYVAEDDMYYHCIGGNQSDMFNIARILKESVVAIRRPEYHVQPSSVKQYFVKATGEISTKED